MSSDFTPPASGREHPRQCAPPATPSKRNSVLPACLIGCLAVGGLACLLCAGGGYYAYSNFRQLASGVARQAISETIRDSQLPPQEKEAILDQVDRVIDSYTEGDINNKQLGKILEQLTASPVMSLIIVQGVEEQYIDASGLTDEEKQQARRTLDRVLRGTVEESIHQHELQELSQHFLKGDSEQGQQELKQRLTDEELRVLIAEAKQVADDANVPDEDFELQLSQEIEKIVDRALGNAISGQPDADPAGGP